MICLKKKHEPVIKKIHLRIWTLRDEVETKITDEIQEGDKCEDALEKCRTYYDKNGKSLESLEKNKHPVIPEEKIIQGSLILSEIDYEDIFFFSNKRFIEGQNIVMEFVIPNFFSFHAETVSCRLYNMKDKVIGDNKLPFRIHAKYLFSNEKEKNNLYKFINSIARSILGYGAEEGKSEDKQKSTSEKEQRDSSSLEKVEAA